MTTLSIYLHAGDWEPAFRLSSAEEVQPVLAWLRTSGISPSAKSVLIPAADFQQIGPRWTSRTVEALSAALRGLEEAHVVELVSQD